MEYPNNFSSRQYVIGKMCNLMGTPLRVAILERLVEEKSCFDIEFLLKHQISLATVKKNLRALNNGGLITRFVVGRNKANIYKVNWDKLLDYKYLFDELIYDLRKVKDSKIKSKKI